MINLQNKVIEFDPFPHILIKNIFDQEFYNQLIANFPEHKYLKKYSSKHGNQKHLNNFYPQKIILMILKIHKKQQSL